MELDSAYYQNSPKKETFQVLKISYTLKTIADQAVK